MQPLKLCSFLAFIAVLQAYELSQNMAEFYCVLNGNFSDRDQVEKDSCSRTPLDVIIQPVVAPALSQVPIVYFELSTAGVLLESLIEIVTQGDDGTIYLKPYNFTRNTDIKPGTFDTNQIKSLTLDDLQGQPDCTDFFEHMGPFIFFANWQECRKAAVNGTRLSYVSAHNCNTFDSVVPAGVFEESTLEPYKFKREGLKFPLENAPGNYVCTCDTTSD